MRNGGESGDSFDRVADQIEKATKLKPVDSMEKLDQEYARSQIE